MKAPKIVTVDRNFSKRVRLHYSNGNGYARCYTCGKVLPLSQLQNGHFIKRQYYSHRWDIRNCRPQCAGCNNKDWGNGEQAVFYSNLAKEYGNEEVELMVSSRNMRRKKDYELIAINEESKKAIKELKDKGYIWL